MADKEMVVHPNHYNQSGIEVSDIIKAYTASLTGVESFFSGNIIKYALRWPHKHETVEGKVEDLRKIIFYTEMLIQEVQNETCSD